jgi:hypothetical protein
MRESMDNSQFSFYMTNLHSSATSVLQFGGYDLKYAKEGSQDQDIYWANLGLDEYWTVAFNDAKIGDKKIENSEAPSDV